ncbi:N-acyl-D-glucosamine 2-epimerase [Paenibacillus naphthalenovorans]|uniref:N-acyl-D-glucosamine 2-epimerase n=1 Tax=Paenibacillus naphthalenovorans TaxID=162209 RepID=UPI003D272EA3
MLIRTYDPRKKSQPPSAIHQLQPSIQIDPTFAYYLDRSEDSVAAELELAGFRAVRYFVTNETQVNGRLIAALRNRGLEVWAMVLGNGAYGTGHLPPGWKDWQMTLLKKIDDGFHRFSLFSHQYLAWKKNAVSRLISRHPFTGFEVAEPYFPEWNGLDSGVYGDVGPLARAAFKRFSGAEMPDFRYPGSPAYYKTDRARYLLWMEFRVQAVNGFLNELINGAGGVRETNPGIRIATWSLAVNAGDDSVPALREYQGIDAAAMIRTVRPDVHILQTHWPDWMRERLKPDYIKHYKPFMDHIRASHASIPIGVQTDIGSLRRMRRSRAWMERFAAAAGAHGYQFWTAYEYSIGLPMYEDKPQPVRAHRPEQSLVVLEFNKRVDVRTASCGQHYRYVSHGSEPAIPVRVNQVDGHRVVLSSEQFPVESFELHITGIRDTPELWLLKNEAGNQTPQGCRIKIPRCI